MPGWFEGLGLAVHSHDATKASLQCTQVFFYIVRNVTCFQMFGLWYICIPRPWLGPFLWAPVLSCLVSSSQKTKVDHGMEDVFPFDLSSVLLWKMVLRFTRRCLPPPSSHPKDIGAGFQSVVWRTQLLEALSEDLLGQTYFHSNTETLACLSASIIS